IIYSSPTYSPEFTLLSSFFFQCSRAHRDLHSFPTRRSSDLRRDAATPARVLLLAARKRLAVEVEVLGLEVRRERRGGLVELRDRSEEHTSELQSQSNLVCRLLLEKKKK